MSTTARVANPQRTGGYLRMYSTEAIEERDYYRCPNCDHLVTALHYTLAREGLRCVRCDGALLVDFVLSRSLTWPITEN